HLPSNAACDDGQYCNGAEVCDPPNGDPTTGCHAGPPVNCDDGIACTMDSCNEVANHCDHAPNNALCGSGELCVPGQGCKVGTPCTSDAQCSDGNPCNGVETCNVICQLGTPVDCDDGIGCTIDSCNPSTGACIHQPDNSVCNDGFGCNGIETCNPQS